MMLTRSKSRPSNVRLDDTSSEPKQSRPSKARRVANLSPEGSLIPEGPGSSQGGEEPLPIEELEPTLSHTRFPEGTLDIYDEVRI
eukprot:974911-Pelagomonas_calceolata.AAC.1